MAGGIPSRYHRYDRRLLEKSFTGYDAVFHVAGIVHIKETRKNAPLYYMVNSDLVVETAKKAKRDGVKQFVFLSSMSVYGLVTGTITPSIIPMPKSNYGRSKLQAEQLLSQLADDESIVTIIRPPMVYGPGCRGNYQTLTEYAKRLPLFPDYPNQRSMIEIKRLCQYLKDRIDKKQKGIFFPQDDNYACTTQIVREIAVQNNYTIYFTKFFNPVIRILKLGL